MNGKNQHFTSELVGIVITTFLALFIANSPLAYYDLQITALLFIIYAFLRNRIKKHSLFYFFEALMFLYIVLSIVFNTGGIESPFFFLLYFLMFALAIILDGASSIILTLLLVLIFITTGNTFSLNEYIPVLSLPFIAPFAQYIGQMRARIKQQKKKLLEVVEKEKHTKKIQIKEKEETMLFLSTILYRHIHDISERLDNFMGDPDLTYLQKKVKRLDDIVQKFRQYVESVE